MWEYNYDYLVHSANHKYIDKVRGTNGQWVYIYDNGNKNTALNSTINRNKILQARAKKAKEVAAKKEEYQKKALEYSKKMQEEMRNRTAGHNPSDLNKKDEETKKTTSTPEDTTKKETNNDSSNENVSKYQSVVNKVIRGEFGSGKERVQRLTEAGYDYNTVQSLVNLIYRRNGKNWKNTTLTAEEIESVLKRKDG